MEMYPEASRIKNRLGLAIASFVISILSLALFFLMFIVFVMLNAAPILGTPLIFAEIAIYYLDVVIIALALIFGILSIKSSSGRGFAIAGTSIGGAAGIIWLIVFFGLNDAKFF